MEHALPYAMNTSPMFAGLASLLFLAISCSTAPKTLDGRADLETRSAIALSRAKAADSTINRLIADSDGYAVFPTIGKGAVGVGGAYGKGVLYEHGTVVGYCDMTQGSIGLQLGGQTYTEVVVFNNEDALSDFKDGDFTFDAQATAVLVKSGAAANANFSRGVAVFTMDASGLMFEAAIGSQTFGYQSK